MTDVKELFDRLADGGPSEPAGDVYERAVTQAGRIRRRRHVVYAALATLAVLVVGSLAWSARPTKHTAQNVTVSPPAAAVTMGDLSAITKQPTALAASGGHVWVVGDAPDDGPVTLLDFDATSHVLVGTTHIPDDSAFSIAPTTARVWLRVQQGEQSTALIAVDKQSHGIAAWVQAGHDGGVAATKDTVWTIDGDRLIRVDPTSGAVKATVPLTPGGFGPLFVATGSSGVWLSNPYDKTMLKVDPAANTAHVVATFPDAVGPLVDTGVAVWITSGTRLVSVDVSTGGRGRVVDLGSRILDLAADGTNLFAVTDAGAVHVDTTSGTFTAVPVPNGGKPTLVATDPDTGATWVTTMNPSAVVQVSTAHKLAGCDSLSTPVWPHAGRVSSPPPDRLTDAAVKFVGDELGTTDVTATGRPVVESCGVGVAVDVSGTQGTVVLIGDVVQGYVPGSFTVGPDVALSIEVHGRHVKATYSGGCGECGAWSMSVRYGDPPASEIQSAQPMMELDLGTDTSTWGAYCFQAHAADGHLFDALCTEVPPGDFAAG